MKPGPPPTFRQVLLLAAALGSDVAGTMYLSVLRAEREATRPRDIERPSHPGSDARTEDADHA